jgi:signal transduction histidine kinase
MTTRSEGARTGAGDAKRPESIAAARRIWHRPTVNRIRARLSPALVAEPAVAASAVRVVMLILCAVVLGLNGAPRSQFAWLLPVVAAAAIASRFGQATLPAMLVRIAEAVVTAVAVMRTGGPNSPFQPYLLAPAFAGGLAAGPGGAVTPPGWAAMALIAGHVVTDPHVSWRTNGAGVTEWLILGIAVGMLGAWIRRLTQVRVPHPNESYAAASRLLVQLRTVTRRLPSGLDPVSIAEDLLASLKTLLPYDRACVFVPTSGSRLVPLCVNGTASLQWNATLTADSPFSAAWHDARPVLLDEPLTRGSGAGAAGAALVLPLRVGDRGVGLVALETTTPSAYQPAAVERGRSLAEDTAVRMETALLFEEVRHLATTEERQRVARQIHDGIAQELVYVGYVLDGLASQARSRPDDLQQPLRDLRAEVTRIISELRLSIFDLRSEVSRSGGLGAALSEHVRNIGRNSGLTVHLSLSESTTRLPTRVEEEILRIAMEAVAAARKRPSAANLWVTLVVEPPLASLVVEDDGIEMRSRRREDSFGLDVMRERAERLHGSVEVSTREPRGTCVRFRLISGKEEADDTAGVAAGGRSAWV